MNTHHRGHDNMSNFPTNPFMTFLSRPLLSNPIIQDSQHMRPLRNFDSDERPMTSTGRRPRNFLDEDMTEHDETFIAHDHSERTEISFTNLPAQEAPQMISPMLLSLMEQISSLEEDTRQGLPQEMIDKVKKMKMGKSGQDCTVCSDTFRRGEKIRKLPCRHIFHDKCLMPWLEQNTTCPNCRFDLFEFFTEHSDGEYQ